MFDSWEIVQSAWNKNFSNISAGCEDTFKLADAILEAILFIKDTKILHILTSPHLPQVVITPNTKILPYVTLR